MFGPDHSGRWPWNHRFGAAHLVATGTVASIALGVVSSLFLPPGAWTLESIALSLAVALPWFYGAYFVSDWLYHAAARWRSGGPAAPG